MKNKSTLQTQSTVFRSMAEDLLLSLWIQVCTFLLLRFGVMRLLRDVVAVTTDRCRIVLAQQRVVGRIFYPGRYAVFRRCLAVWALG